MNKNTILSHIKKLKRIQISPKELQSVKEELTMRIGNIHDKKTLFHFNKSNINQHVFIKRLPYFIIPVIILLFFLFSLQLNPFFMQNVLFHFEYSLMPSQLEKTTISLAYTEAQLQNISSVQVTTPKLDSLLFSTDRTYELLAKLKLSGMPNEYTKDQCHALYLAYEAYLHSAQNQLVGLENSSKNKEIRVRASFINNELQNYEKKMDSRLSFYK